MPVQQNPPTHRHKRIAAWALACAERSLVVYERDDAGDVRPRRALAALQAWIAGADHAEEARTASLAAHAAARESVDEAARLAARSAAQAAGVVRSVRHAPHAASYARRAIAAAGGDEESELAWQRSNADDVVRAFLAAQILQPAEISGETK